MAKKLSADSVLNPADLDGDGEITNSELDRHERMIRIENNDKLQDQQRLICWVSVIASAISIGLVVSPLIDDARGAYGDGFAFNLRCSQHGHCSGFYGSHSLYGSKRMEHKNIDWESVVFILKQRIKAVKDLLKDEAKKSKAKNTKTS